MATKIPGETYRGEALHLPLSQDGQVAAYVWPLRILKIREKGCGGPTLGIDVGNEEVLRWDCHDAIGHWHGGGYDRLERPGNSHRDFPEGVNTVATQVEWAFQQIQNNTKELLKEAEYGPAADLVDPTLVATAIDSIKAHLAKHSALRPQAIEDNLIAT
jgi:hypothetical protein